MKNVRLFIALTLAMVMSFVIVNPLLTNNSQDVVVMGSLPDPLVESESIKTVKAETLATELENTRIAKAAAAAEAARVAEEARLAAIAAENARLAQVKRDEEARQARIAAAKAKASRDRAVEAAKVKAAPVKKAASAPAQATNHEPPGGIAACIRKYESGNNYRAQNSVSTASGAYQFINGTWRSITGRSDTAKDAPPAVQDAAFYKLWNNGKGASHWVVAPKCGY